MFKFTHLKLTVCVNMVFALLIIILVAWNPLFYAGYNNSKTMLSFAMFFIVAIFFMLLLGFVLNLVGVFKNKRNFKKLIIYFLGFSFVISLYFAAIRTVASPKIGSFGDGLAYWTMEHINIEGLYKEIDEIKSSGDEFGISDIKNFKNLEGTDPDIIKYDAYKLDEIALVWRGGIRMSWGVIFLPNDESYARLPFSKLIKVDDCVYVWWDSN